MITLIQFPWSPFCITARHILVRHGIPHRIRNVPTHDRTPVIRATHGRGYTVPSIVDGRKAVYDATPLGQEVARYIDNRFHLGLFPGDKEGIQAILSRFIENDLEDAEFRITDSLVIPTLPLVERVMLTRFKERKFGRGCVDQWTRQRARMTVTFHQLLEPIDQMLASSEFLIADRPLFVDYNLFGVMGNFLYSGRTRFPNWKHLRRWHAAMKRK